MFTRPDSRDAPHLFGLGLQEMLADEITSDLRAIRTEAIEAALRRGRPVTERLSAKGIDYGTLRALPDGSVDTTGVEGVDPDLRVRPFFAQGGTISIREFVVGAFNAEMGLEASDPLLHMALSGLSITTPAGMVLDGSLDQIETPPAPDPGADPDGDDVLDETPTALIDHMEFYLLNPLFSAFPDGDLPSLKLPDESSFVVRNFFADLKRHDLGPAFHERQFDGSVQTEFMTEPLWGVGSTAPYGHDGRSINLHSVILRHGGEAQASRNAFAKLNENKQSDLIAFLNTLVLFPPDDTASNLNPGNPAAPGFPQVGHGSINLGALFNDPSEPE